MTAPVGEDFDRYISADMQANYRRVVADQHGGDWTALGRQFAVDGEARLARWAYAQQITRADAVDVLANGSSPIRGRRVPGREVA